MNPMLDEAEAFANAAGESAASAQASAESASSDLAQIDEKTEESLT